MKVSLQIFNPQKTMARILDDKTGIFTAETCGRCFEKYAPKQSGVLGQTRETEPFKVTYTSPYSHYLYEGRMMVSPSGSSWARLGEVKHYNGKKLSFSTEQNINATDHWDKAAMAAHGGEISKEITEYIKRR